VTDTDLANNHYRIVGNDRLLWSGHTTTWEADPQRYVRRLKADMTAVYPQLGEVEVEHAWSGVLGNALHRMPQIGELSPGVWLASAFGGHGINTTAMAGNILAEAVVEGDDTWRLFAPFELVWAGGGLGRAAMQVFYWWFNGLERFEARAARQREAEDQRVAGRVARRGGDDETDVEARLGAGGAREGGCGGRPRRKTQRLRSRPPIRSRPRTLPRRRSSAMESMRCSKRACARALRGSICPTSPSSRTMRRAAGRPLTRAPNVRFDPGHKRVHARLPTRYARQ